MVDISNKDIYELLQTAIKKSDTIETQIKTNKEELKQEIRNITSEIKNEIDILKQTNNELREENKNLKDRLITTERKLRKYNLIFYGLKENNDSIDEARFFLELVVTKLNIDCRYSDIRDFHRIGKKSEGKNRPVLIEFINYQLKLEILTNARKLKGTGISVANDYIQEDYQQRKVLRTNLKIARENNHEAYIKNNELFVNGDKYTYEDLQEQPMQIVEEDIIEGEIENTGNNTPSTSATRTNIPGQRSKCSMKLSPKQVSKKRKEQPTEEELTEEANPLKRSNRFKKKQ